MTFFQKAARIVFSLSISLPVCASLLATTHAFVPVVSSAALPNGVRIRTALQLNNRSAQGMTGKLIYRSAATAEPHTINYGLAAHETLSWDDILITFDQLGATGSLELVADGRGIPSVVARTYSEPSDLTGGLGTTGTTVPLVRADVVATSGSHMTLLSPSRSRFDFGLGVRSLGDGATLRFTVYSAQGVVIKTVDNVIYTPNALVQRTAEDALGTTLVGDESIDVEVVAGSAIVYGTTTDHASGDASFTLAAKN